MRIIRILKLAWKYFFMNQEEFVKAVSDLDDMIEKRAMEESLIIRLDAEEEIRQLNIRTLEEL